MASSNKSKIHNAVLQDIIMGAYQSGEVLSERRLMEKYGVSKSPVREALVELCNENVLRSIPRYGYEIISLTEQDIHDVLTFRTMVECQCLRISADHLTPEEADELLTYTRAESGKLASLDVWESWDSNSHFHLKLLSYCGNRYCYEQVARSLALLKRAYAQFYWDKWKRVNLSVNNGDHLQIVESLIKGSLDEAEHLLAQDIGSFGVRV